MPVQEQNKQELERKLEQKYGPVINQAKQFGAKIEKSHVESNKLVLRLAVPNDQVKNKIWDQVKSIDRDFSDLALDIHVDQTLGGGSAGQMQPQPQQKAATGERTYTVKRGDTLSEIAQQFYGNANEYMKIFNANRDQLKNPDQIQAGQTLKIPQ